MEGSPLGNCSSVAVLDTEVPEGSENNQTLYRIWKEPTNQEFWSCWVSMSVSVSTTCIYIYIYIHTYRT